MFVAALSMAGTPAESPEHLESDYPSAIRIFHGPSPESANPSSGYFPPAGALCALYVEKARKKRHGQKAKRCKKMPKGKKQNLETSRDI